ncbi:hypothetical protein [uncultured Maribacter sp.]|uniref:hypothetical protein n=1 Tax=uncultured Maribacter sp. TaxID=431308 RepID=UPI00260B697C|nr:hypothetical protein [uncultured Maribacter sp.]
MNFNYLYSIFFLVFISSCTPSSSDPEPEVSIEDPVAATLIFPDDNTECNEGTVLSDTESKVVFLWDTSEYTDSYQVVLKNMLTDSIVNFDAFTNSKEIILERGVSYQWNVISKSIISENTASSETFQFFNAAPGEVNHVPFSAEAIAPENNSLVTADEGNVNLEWQAIDIDDDIKDYEVFFGTQDGSLLSQGITNSSSLVVDVISGNKYFWKVKTNDEKGNSSISEIFQFTVQ